MNAAGLAKCPTALVALALCSACAGSAVAPSTATLSATYVGRTLSVNGRLVTAARLGPPNRYAAIAPHGHGRRPHEYVINDYGTYAGIFNYPKSTNQKGIIDNVGGQGCTNVLSGYGKKTFWIVAGTAQITNYKVPQTPIKTLSVPSGANPSSCAMNTAGDLAVGILYGSDTGDIFIFKHASGKGTAIPTPLAREYFDGYDAKGNLFLDGFTNASAFQLDEIPSGTKTVQTIVTSNTVGFPGSVQWDGTYLTVTDQANNSMYQYTVTGTHAKLKGTIRLMGAGDCAQTWIVMGLVYCADATNQDGAVFKYPAGGSALAILGSGFPLPLGTVAANKY